MNRPDPLDPDDWTKAADWADIEPITFTAYYDQPKGGQLLGARTSGGIRLTEAGREFAVRAAAGEFSSY